MAEVGSNVEAMISRQAIVVGVVKNIVVAVAIVAGNIRLYGIAYGHGDAVACMVCPSGV